MSAVESLEGPLLQVEGLSDLRLELHSKKMNLHLVLIDELHRHLYIKSTSRVVQRNKEKGKMRLKRLFAISVLWQCRIRRNIFCFPECCCSLFYFSFNVLSLKLQDGFVIANTPCSERLTFEVCSFIHSTLIMVLFCEDI